MPPTEKRGRVHTSTVTVSVVDPIQAEVKVNENDFVVEWYSGSGKGGQHRNKHQNSCRITHKPTGITKKHESRNRADSYANAKAALMEAIRDQVLAERTSSQSKLRKEQVGSGMRGDKRRTYRFQDDVVVDHETGKKTSIAIIMRGAFDKLW